MYTNVSTEHDLLQSIVKLDELIEFLKAHNIKTIGIANHSMNGYLTIIRTLKAHDIKGVFGLKRLVIHNEAKYPITAYHLNETGYKNVVKLASLSVLTLNDLVAHQEGVRFVVPIDSASQWIESVKASGLSVCLGLNRLNGEAHANEALIGTWQLPAIIYQEMTYLKKDDALAYRVALAIRESNPLESFEAFPEQKHICTPDELRALYGNHEALLTNTNRFLESCVSFVPDYKAMMPKFPIETGEESELYFRRVTLEKLEAYLQAMSEDKKAIYRERLHYELNVICKMKYEDYFLIVADFMEFARNNGIMTGPGRGSSASSLIAYVLGITQVDPLHYDLLFERFLNPARVSLPDIDIDFIDSRRLEVIQYVAHKYGKAHVTQINTFGTLSAKAVSRDVGRMFKFEASKLDRISKMITASKKDKLVEVAEKSKDFQAFLQEQPVNQVWYEICLRLEGLSRNESTHAAGVILSPMPFTDIAPISRENDGIYCAQWTMGELESIGLLKMDFLGLRNLGLVEAILKSIEKTYNVKLPLHTMPLNNRATYQLLARGLTDDVFQLESAGMKKTLQQVKPSRFEDVIAINALFRPGPMEFIPMYAERKNEGLRYEMPEVLKPILSETYGIIVFQEQILKIAQLFAGMTLAEADLLRRAISKKKREVLEEQEALFVKGATSLGHTEQLAKEVYALILKFAEYGFPKSHSTAYSVITYQLAYFKANYPAHFYACVLNQGAGDANKVKRIIEEMRMRQIPVVPPRYPEAQYECSAVNQQVHLGYNIIKNIVKPKLEALVNLPKQTDLFELVKMLGYNYDETMMQNLAAVGVFDDAFGKPRRMIVASLSNAKIQSEMGLDLGFAVPEYQDDESLNVLELEKKAYGFYFSEHPLKAIRSDVQTTATSETMQEKATVRLLGIVDAVKEVETKKKELMAFVTISDEYGSVSTTLFANVYATIKDKLSKDAIVVIDGFVENRNSKLQVKVNKIFMK